MHNTLATLVATVALGWSGLLAAEEPLFPFVISYDAPGNVTDVSAWLQRPAGKQGFVRDRGGRLATDAGPIRFWGTNFVFGACFPAHDEAGRVAVRLARLGINCVRMHHMDAHAIWGNSPNKLTIDPQQIERLDYLIYQLKLHGIYTNLNLHVSRWFDEAEGFVAREQRPECDKGLDNFEPRMIELQKKYARDLLTHVNPYLKTAYAREPAVAFVEISNEDALFDVWSSGKLDRLPDPYITTFRKLWNGWLRRKYGSTEKLRAAWSAGTTTARGVEMLRNGNFARPLEEGWCVERANRAKVEVSIMPVKPEDRHRMLRLVVVQSGRVPWNPQLIQAGLTIKKGAVYTLAFRLRSDTSQWCVVTCEMAHEPWLGLGFRADVAATPQWQEHRVTFIATHDETNARITFNRLPPAAYELADVSLQLEGIVGLGPKQRLEDDSVSTVRRSLQTSPANYDFSDFLWDTERGYWQGMYRYLKDELQVQSLVSGTQLGYSPVHVQAGLDYLDAHAYWQHPVFPGRPWDRKDWYVNDIAMVNHPDGMLPQLAGRRVAGKPYTVSEYNHPTPNAYAAEGFPMIAAFGAFQNWDGIYSFAYSHNRQFEPRRIESFFDIKSDTAKLAHMPACVAMFLRGDVAPASHWAAFPFSLKKELRDLREMRTARGLTADDIRHDPRYPLVHGTALDLADGASCAPHNQGIVGRTVSDTSEICWDVSQEHAGCFTVNTRRSKLLTGFVGGRTFPLGAVTLKIGATQRNWATVSLVAFDGEGFDQPGRILVAATGLVQNRDAKLERLGDDRVTLRDHWGREPVLCEGIQGSITLPVPAARVKCYPLDESGNRRTAITVGGSGNTVQIDLDPRHKTVWYEVQIRPAGS
jgi:hypothetical protein